MCFSFCNELMFAGAPVGSLLLECVLSFAAKAKENVSFSVLHGRFIV